MPTLEASLIHLPHRDLRAIATRLGVRRRDQHHKSAWIRAIGDVWHDAHRPAGLLAALSPAAQMALHRLYQAGALPALAFFTEYGPIRRATPTVHFSPPPWERPANASEELFYCGLLVAATPGNIDRAHYLTIPEDIRPLLSDRWRPPPPAAGPPAAPQPAGLACLLHDVGQALVFLCTLDSPGPDVATTGRARWLSPAQLAVLNQRLLIPEPDPLPSSHKRAPRLRFLFFLLAAAGLVADTSPRPAAHGWLAQPPVRQVATLWEAWQTAPFETRTAYAQPEARFPPPWPQPLLAALGAQSGAFTAPALANRLLGRDPGQELQSYFAAHLPDLCTLDRQIDETLQAALRAFGVVHLVTNRDAAGAGWSQVDALSPTYTVTPTGAWLLRGRRGRPPRGLGFAGLTGAVFFGETPRTDAPRTEGLLNQDPRAEPARAGWTVGLPALDQLAAQAALAPYAAYIGFHRTGRPPRHHYHLCESSVAAAAAAGHGLPALLTALQLLGLSLSSDQIAQLAGWHASGRQLQLLTLAVLRAESRGLMQQIHQTPALRSLLGELLSPTYASVTAPTAEMLAALRQAGFHPEAVGAPPVTAPTAAGALNTTAGATGAPEQLPPPDAALWLAGQLYVLLGQHLDLPLPPPFARLQAEFGRFTPPDAAVLTAQWQTLREWVLDLLDGRAFTPPPAPADPELWRPIIADALARGAYLDMTYFTAGRNMLTRRLVEPYWIEEAHGVPYLRAHCHTTGKVRTFRLDRIQSLGIREA